MLTDFKKANFLALHMKKVKGLVVYAIIGRQFIVKPPGEDFVIHPLVVRRQWSDFVIHNWWSKSQVKKGLKCQATQVSCLQELT